ncbi:MAG: class I SAM-dependent methyltransferase [Gammaproteobacteria bacterium]|nr:class I SAM-dependent methyltransferase [Gammaproteobacteria bacterium]
MTQTTLAMTQTIYQYYIANSLREDPILTQLRKETAKLSSSKMQIAPEEGQLLAFIIQILGATKTLDIGVYTGYSSLVAAMAMPQGKVISCDINNEWTKIAKKYWQLANQEHKIDLRIAPALETLDNLIKAGQENSFDFIFIDADKKNYDEYYERGLQLLRQGGVMAVDNVLWGGQVADLADNDENTTAIRNLNKKVLQDSRVTMTMIPIADGLTLVTKNGLPLSPA